MPANSSVIEAESSRAANAHVARPSALAALQSQNLERLIEDGEWYNSDPVDFLSRIVAEHCRLSTEGRDISRPGHRPASSTSSMAVSIHTHHTSPARTTSTYAPSLVSDSTTRSRSSAYTGVLSHLQQTYALDENDDSTSETSAAQNAELDCCFSFLACTFRSDNFAEWNTHCQSHFHGRLPKKVHCPFVQCDWSTSGETGEEAWRQRTVHVVCKHRGRGQVDTWSRPDSSLIHHLWQHRLIGDAEKKELRQRGRLDNNHVFTISAGPGRDRRRNRHPPTAVRV